MSFAPAPASFSSWLTKRPVRSTHLPHSGQGRLGLFGIPSGDQTDLSWCSLAMCTGLSTDGLYMYATTWSSESYGTPGTIVQIDISTGTITNANWSTSVPNNPFAMVFVNMGSGAHMYVTQLGGTGITQINTSGVITNSNWCTGLNNPCGMAFYNTYMFVSNNGNGTISKVNLMDGSILDAVFTDLNTPYDISDNSIGQIVCVGSYLYVAITDLGAIAQIDVTTGDVINPYWYQNEWAPFAISQDPSNNLYVTSYDGYVASIAVQDDNTASLNGVLNDGNPLGLLFGILYYNNEVYVADIDNSMIVQLDPVVSSPPLSNTCFVSNTMIQTDAHGWVPIQNLSIHKDQYRIRGHAIQSITQTISVDKYLVFIPMGAIGPNSPDRDTLVSLRHEIMIYGQMKQAHELVSLYSDRNIRFVPYENQILYNVVLANQVHGHMVANRMIVETLHPNNPMAKLALLLDDSRISWSTKQKYVQQVRDMVQHEFDKKQSALVM